MAADDGGGMEAAAEDWQEDEELVEGELICLLATGRAKGGRGELG